MQSCATACIGRITECMQAQVWQIWDVHWLKAFTKAKWPRLMAYGTYLLLQHSPGRLCLKINHTCSILNGTFYPFLFFPRCLISFGFKRTRHLIEWFIIPKVLVKKGKKFTSHTLGLSANKRRVSLSNRRTNLTNASQIWGKEKGKNYTGTRFVACRAGVILMRECSVFSWPKLWPPYLILMAVEGWWEKEICTKGAVDSQK